MSAFGGYDCHEYGSPLAETETKRTKGLTAMNSTRIALCDVSGPLTDLIQKLSGDDGASWSRALNKMLRKENPWEMAAVWKTITLGAYKTPAAYRKALTAAGHKIGSWGDDILGRITCAKQETEVDLVSLTVAELGFKDGAYYKDICAKAIEMGLELCPAEVGPALRLAYNDQPRGEWLRIAMEAITDSDGSRRIFAVGHDNDELWLIGIYGLPEFFWFSDSRFVFLRRK